MIFPKDTSRKENGFQGCIPLSKGYNGKGGIGDVLIKKMDGVYSNFHFCHLLAGPMSHYTMTQGPFHDLQKPCYLYKLPLAPSPNPTSLTAPN